MNQDEKTPKQPRKNEAERTDETPEKVEEHQTTERGNVGQFNQQYPKPDRR